MLVEYRMWLNAEQPDAIGWKPEGTSMLVECKASRADFLSDAKKSHRRPAGEMPPIDGEGAAGMGMYRYYLAEEGIVRPSDNLGDWGLLVPKGAGCTIKRPAPQRHDCDKEAERRLLINGMRRATDYVPVPVFKPLAERERERVKLVSELHGSKVRHG